MCSVDDTKVNRGLGVLVVERLVGVPGMTNRDMLMVRMLEQLPDGPLCVRIADIVMNSHSRSMVQSYNLPPRESRSSAKHIIG